MALKLKWENPNVVPTKTKIYRGDSPLDVNALPSALTVLDEGVLEWVDPTAEFGKTYYYILGSKTDVDEVFTPNQQILVADNRGVGPSVLQSGDDNLGYFGQVLSSDFVNSTHLLAAAKITTGLPGNTVTPAWNKFLRKGKVIYVPSQNFGLAAWVDLYNAGFVYGVDANGPTDAVLTGLTPTNQLRTIIFKGDTYKIRLLRGMTDRPVTADIWAAQKSSHELLAVDEPNEYNDFVYPLMWPTPLKYQRYPNIFDDEPDNILGAPGSYGDSSQMNTDSRRMRIVCQERNPAANAVASTIVTRGQRPVWYYNNNRLVYNRDYVSAMQFNAGNDAGWWYPVLELVEQSVVVAKG